MEQPNLGFESITLSQSRQSQRSSPPHSPQVQTTNNSSLPQHSSIMSTTSPQSKTLHDPNHSTLTMNDDEYDQNNKENHTTTQMQEDHQEDHQNHTTTSPNHPQDDLDDTAIPNDYDEDIDSQPYPKQLDSNGKPRGRPKKFKDDKAAFSLRMREARQRRADFLIEHPSNEVPTEIVPNIHERQRRIVPLIDREQEIALEMRRLYEKDKSKMKIKKLTEMEDEKEVGDDVIISPSTPCLDNNNNNNDGAMGSTPSPFIEGSLLQSLLVHTPAIPSPQQSLEVDQKTSNDVHPTTITTQVSISPPVITTTPKTTGISPPLQPIVQHTALNTQLAHKTIITQPQQQKEEKQQEKSKLSGVQPIIDTTTNTRNTTTTNNDTKANNNITNKSPLTSSLHLAPSSSTTMSAIPSSPPPMAPIDHKNISFTALPVSDHVKGSVQPEEKTGYATRSSSRHRNAAAYKTLSGYSLETIPLTGLPIKPPHKNRKIKPQRKTRGPAAPKPVVQPPQSAHLQSFYSPQQLEQQQLLQKQQVQMQYQQQFVSHSHSASLNNNNNSNNMIVPPNQLNSNGMITSGPDHSNNNLHYYSTKPYQSMAGPSNDHTPSNTYNPSNASSASSSAFQSISQHSRLNINAQNLNNQNGLMASPLPQQQQHQQQPITMKTGYRVTQPCPLDHNVSHLICESHGTHCPLTCAANKPPMVGHCFHSDHQQPQQPRPQQQQINLYHPTPSPIQPVQPVQSQQFPLQPQFQQQLFQHPNHQTIIQPSAQQAIFYPQQQQPITSLAPGNIQFLSQQQQQQHQFANNVQYNPLLQQTQPQLQQPQQQAAFNLLSPSNNYIGQVSQQQAQSIRPIQPLQPIQAVQPLQPAQPLQQQQQLFCPTQTLQQQPHQQQTMRPPLLQMPQFAPMQIPPQQQQRVTQQQQQQLFQQQSLLVPTHTQQLRK